VLNPPVGKPPAPGGNFFAHRDKRFEKKGEERGEREKEKGRERKERGKGGKGPYTSYKSHYISNTMAKV
jgi:hypothetical protein